ncbi:MAG: hypothetical protein M1837_000937 [Sclerophora amabilis]|nr:MAG: hypothetical protein M1837_000937 [Sclerophora amabilis]
MAAPGEDVQVRTSSEATQNFVESFYPSLTSKRSTITSFYEPASKMADGKSLPDITFNGNIYGEPVDFQNLFEKDMPRTHFDIQSYDCHIINPNYLPSDSKEKPVLPGKNMSLLVSVSGTVQFGDDADAEERAFSESFVLVPNEDFHAAKNRGSGKKEWLIQSQNFRLVV